jgi:virginiamycin B lyase
MIRCLESKSGGLTTLVYSVLVLTGLMGMAAAQTVQEFPPPIPGSAPWGITAGADGALWFTEGAKIGRITTSGMVTEYSIPTPGEGSLGIAAGPDGALWFTRSMQIGRITTTGSVTVFTLPTDQQPVAIAAGPDGALWYTRPGAIGRITTSGAITEFPLNGNPYSIAAGPDGALWFADGVNKAIGRITTAGTITEFQSAAVPASITAGSDGALWFTEIGGGTANIVGRITTAGQITEFPLGRTNDLRGITSGPDGALWFTDTESNSVGRITTGGMITEYPIPTRNGLLVINAVNSVCCQIAAGPDGALWFTEPYVGQIGRVSLGSTSGPSPLVAAVLPSSRSVEVGNTATAFATIINSGSSAASGCAIVPVTTVPASFVYQTTNPATNALIGSPNTPVSIAAGGSQSFVIAFTPNAPSAPTIMILGFDCTGVSAAPSNTGLNTLLLSASTTPVPDIVALAATAMNDGILHITGTSGSNAFAVATVNVGASASITATANTGAATLPLAISLCQTNPMSGQCISSIGSSVTTTINANATPTFAIFATASGSVPFLPQTNRIFVQFADANGIVRGSTSVAVETQ